MDADGNLYVTGTQTENFEFAGNDAVVLALGAYIAKYNSNGEEIYRTSAHHIYHTAGKKMRDVVEDFSGTFSL